MLHTKQASDLLQELFPTLADNNSATINAVLQLCPVRQQYRVLKLLSSFIAGLGRLFKQKDKGKNRHLASLASQTAFFFYVGAEKPKIWGLQNNSANGVGPDPIFPAPT